MKYYCGKILGLSEYNALTITPVFSLLVNPGIDLRRGFAPRISFSLWRDI